MENTGTFNYTYSAQQQEEIKGIMEKYTAREESKIDLLRRLDRSTKSPGTVASIAIGTVGSLLLGVGMACVTEWTDFFAHGIAAGVVGIALMSVAYPVYAAMTRKRRERLAPQILKLGDELMR
ncbi:MAG: hypothetical protein LBI44_06940 [Oscillospiraceae bacterium]|jgi:hypothetical protein|nr:hypothetical protein [Oscillospiraceae bacterium]